MRIRNFTPDGQALDQVYGQFRERLANGVSRSKIGICLTKPVYPAIRVGSLCTRRLAGTLLRGAGLCRAGPSTSSILAVFVRYSKPTVPGYCNVISRPYKICYRPPQLQPNLHIWA
uniref:Uncharacterized protein n=1 Tax=Romanomermis culicivorax TaxID=13658 RepID=A0A915JVC1_ROMCU